MAAASCRLLLGLCRTLPAQQFIKSSVRSVSVSSSSGLLPQPGASSTPPAGRGGRIKFSAPIPEFSGDPGISGHGDLYRLSIDNPDLFWSRLARSRLRWMKDFDVVQDCDVKKGKIGWFLKGKLNVADNCVDRHVENDPERVALIWEKDEPGTQEYVTYRQLYELMNRLANTLKSHGVKKGDRVVIYMPISPMTVGAMLACARLGAIHSVVFAGFSAEALASRIQDASAETVLTSDQAIRGGKVIELKRVVDSAVAKCPSVKRVFVSRRTGANDVPMTGAMDIPLDEELSRQSTECPVEPMDSEDPLFVLYTSGSTGKPKGLVHTQAGYLLFAAFTHQTVFDYRKGDVFGCMADIGWITGHSYGVYGPLCNGATSVLFESIPTYPDPGRYWETVERLRINQFYAAPTAIRLLLRFDDEYVRRYDRSSLKLLGSVGEPINHEAWQWFHRVVGEGRCPIVDTWWQSETGGILISPRPSDPDDEILPAMPMRPMYGVEPQLLNDKGMLLIGREMYGSLCIRNIWPGICRTIYNDHQRFLDTYFNRFPGYYFSGDGAHRLEGKYYKITGRTDDVINVSGHRLGTAEIEDILDEHEFVAETAVVGYPHKVKGEGVYAFVVLKENVPSGAAQQVTRDLRALVKEGIASYAVPEVIQISPGLPKTRSGKIMRRILRKIAASGSADDLGDTSTLADPSVVQTLLHNHSRLRQRTNDSASSSHKKQFSELQ